MQQERCALNFLFMDSVFEESPLASSIRLKRQARKVHVISLYLYNNAATIYISHHT